MSNGRNEYKNKIDKKISDFLERNKDKNCLNGFRYFIDGMSFTSVYSYVTIVNHFLDISGKTPENLTIDDYTIYLGKLKREDRTPSYRIVTYTALKKFSDYLYSRGISDKNPMQYVERPKGKEKIETEKKRETGFLETSEIKELNSNIESGIGSKKAKSFQKRTKERDRAIVTIFLNTGMRCSALCNLDVSDLHPDKKQISGKDKGDKTFIYNLTDEAWENIEKWLLKRNTINSNTDALFIKDNGQRLGYQGVNRLIKKYSKSIEGKTITPHKLRATYGTQLYNATKDIKFVQKCMNHSNPQTTMLYIRGDENKTKEASEIMSKLISG